MSDRHICIFFQNDSLHREYARCLPWSQNAIKARLEERIKRMSHSDLCNGTLIVIDGVLVDDNEFVAVTFFVYEERIGRLSTTVGEVKKVTRYKNI